MENVIFKYFKGNFIFFLDDNAPPNTFLPVSVNCSLVKNTYPTSFLLPENPNDNYCIMKGTMGYTIWKGDKIYEEFGWY